jgi:hypothetical protein
VSDIKIQKEYIKAFALKFEHLRNVRKILIKLQQQMSLQTKLDSFLKPSLLRSKTSKISESSVDE